MDQPDEGSGPSAALLAAQARLQSLQEQRRTERLAQGLPDHRDQDGRHLPTPDPTRPPSVKDNLLPPPSLPSHLGWQSAPFTAALRLAQAHGSAASPQPPTTSDRPSFILHPSSFILPPSPPPTVKLHPDLALAMLKQRQTAAGRLWLLLQWLDATHCGWVNVEAARRHLCEKTSENYLCGWRQLRNLFAQGEGLFWHRSDGRLWLRSTAKVAASLGVERLGGRPIALPIETLRRGIGHARAHLYASFHSGRMKAEGRRMKAASNNSSSFALHPSSFPISRATLSQLSRAGRRTQQRYERRANVHRHTNYAITPPLSVEEEQEQAWRHGRALFHFTDHQGLQGRPGRTYLARQLPNSYSGPHAQQPRGRQKRLNRQLADLFTKGMTGNGRSAVQRRFYDAEQQAARAYNRAPDQDAYWPDPITQRYSQRIWRLLPGRASP